MGFCKLYLNIGKKIGIVVKDKKSDKSQSPLKRPLKPKNLKIIDHLGTLYATFDGSSLWKIEKAAFNVMQMCNGKKTVEQIVEEVSKKILHRPEDVKPVVEKILSELTERKFLEWV